MTKFVYQLVCLSLFVSKLWAVTTPAPKVGVGVYFESCCPFSQAFIVDSFAPAYNTPGFTDIASIVMVPYGHEKYNESSHGEYTFTCQHGPNECAGQRIESCVIQLSNSDPTVYIPFIMNLEIKLNAIGCYNATCCDPTPYAELVAQDLQMSWNEINQCVQTSQGDYAVLFQAQLTEDLNPALTA
ncbi:hypothetical protein RFI_10776 [Reticulomyxa filosa]|uniref:Gamma-interferon-inducible lysosomal thiol reductase n=1 Tax=Reticulomyxa filosa TaxID=46433 RepID=X6NKE9_RETFI|nr:hypothetical protein RFI_10776 [Reticulomyxa filosa]|eukprot:ETO26363.1 hypothetical protein RFI_10776 [Reticulomyxa filosa]